MDTVSLIQLAALGGAMGFFGAGYMLARVGGPRARESTRVDLGGGGLAPGATTDVELLNDAVARLQYELTTARREADQATENVRALTQLVESKAGLPAANREGAPERPRPGAADEVTVLHEAVERLERDLTRSQQEAREATENLRAALAMKVAPAAPAKTVGQEQVASMTDLITKLERELAHSRQEEAKARDEVRSLRDLVQVQRPSQARAQ